MSVQLASSNSSEGLMTKIKLEFRMYYIQWIVFVWNVDGPYNYLLVPAMTPICCLHLILVCSKDFQERFVLHFMLHPLHAWNIKLKVTLVQTPIIMTHSVVCKIDHTQQCFLKAEASKIKSESQEGFAAVRCLQMQGGYGLRYQIKSVLWWFKAVKMVLISKF